MRAVQGYDSLMRARLLALSLPVLLAACGVPFSMSVKDFSIPVSSSSEGSICYSPSNQAAQPHVGSVSLSGQAGYTNDGGQQATVKFTFYVRQSAPTSGATVNGLTCVPAGSDTGTAIGPVTISGGQSNVAYRLSGAALDAAVQAGNYWIGASLQRTGLPFNIGVVDYGAVDFTNNHVTFSLQ